MSNIEIWGFEVHQELFLNTYQVHFWIFNRYIFQKFLIFFGIALKSLAPCIVSVLFRSLVYLLKHILPNLPNHGLRLLHRRSRLDSYSQRFTSQEWMNLRPGQPMPCEGNWVVSPRCWRDTDLHSVFNCENGLLSLMQFNHIHIHKFFILNY